MRVFARRQAFTLLTVASCQDNLTLFQAIDINGTLRPLYVQPIPTLGAAANNRQHPGGPVLKPKKNASFNNIATSD